ncbi:MAG TPA: FAD-dependent oxidoreductase [Pirellulaceae bacterium]|nr:FAD-dependent oxidoreductase [Pirellulaceae bacterium]
MQRTDLEGVVVVCGAGAAGIAAAVSAARQGAKVVLLEAGPRVGGTVASALIHTLAGFFDSAGELLNDGLCRELVQRLTAGGALARRRKMGRLWVLHICPNAYQTCMAQWLGDNKRIDILCGARASGIVRSGGSIRELTAIRAGESFRLTPAAVIDATGTAEVARLIGRTCVLDDKRPAAGGWVFRLRGVAPGALAIPRGVALVRRMREAAGAGELPAECGHVWLDLGCHEDEAFVKQLVPMGDEWQARESRGEISARARETQDAIVKFLRRLPEFARAEVVQTGSLGIRDGGRIRGRYTLSGDDVRHGRKFSDAAGRCAWPIEYWDSERGISLEYLPDGTHYEIPMSALQLPGIENFWAVGKCLSADRYAHASARVVGACWAMGEAAGQAAAACASANRVACGGAR